MKKHCCVVKKILLTQKAAILLFGKKVVEACAPKGFGKKLAWYLVLDLLDEYARTTPTILISEDIFSQFIAEIPESDLKGVTHRACRADVLAMHYQAGLEVRKSHPTLDRIGATDLGRLFSLSKGYVHSSTIKFLALDPRSQPAIWSITELLEELDRASADTAMARLKQLSSHPRELEKVRLTKLVAG